MHDDSALVETRIARFVRERLEPARYRDRVPATIERWDAPGEPVPFAEAVAQGFEPVFPGTPWGRAWGTTWFRVTVSSGGRVAQRIETRAPGVETVAALAPRPAGVRPELVVDLGFSSVTPGFQCEALVWRPDGTIVKAVEPRNRAVPLELIGAGFETRPPSSGAPQPAVVYLEAASNPDVSQGWTFAPTLRGEWETAGDEPLYVLGAVELALRDETVDELLHDVRVLRQLAAQLPAESSRRAQIVRALERMVDAMDPDDVAGTAAEGRGILAPVLAAPAWASSHRVHAVGHAHIDSAWLWPVRETVRKVARTFSNVDALIAEHPGFVFAASSAQQYAWLKRDYPELFERVRSRVREGSFVPVGGMWVESDTNLPGGEALARQFVAGKRFFMEEFGVEPLEVWLPDSFGYSAALPQLVHAAGSRWFLTQKISWNETNRFPHHTFRWQGLDGTEVFTHFPPVDTYNAELTGEELALAERQYAEKGVANTSLVPFGYGDGGGGPTREMLASAHRAASLEGSPQVRLSSPREFFEAAEAEYPAPPVWAGELYLEFHRGTYTSQARTKRGNRRCEHLLREAELWATTAAVRGAAQYPRTELDEAWQTVLLQQFHDILPGSSIAWVHREAERRYAEVAEVLEEVIERSVRALAGTGDRMLRLNAGPYAVSGVPGLGGVEVSSERVEEGAPATVSSERVEEGAPATVSKPAQASDEVSRRSFVAPQPAGVTGGVSRRSFVAPQPAEATRIGERIILANAHLEAVLDAEGLLVSLRHREPDGRLGREAIAPGRAGNLLQLFRDTPNQWDAWDIDAHYARNVVELREAESIEVGVTVRITRRFGASVIVETVSLGADSRALELEFEIDWHERQKLLKLAFPLDVHAERATSEIQFGHIHRPTHANTSWDAARFETVAHRWVHVGEPGYGVAIANDSTYGHDVRRDADAARPGATVTTARLSLLRAPRYPDPEADQGEHHLRVTIMPGAGIPDAVAEGYRMNLPLREIDGVDASSIAPLVDVTGAVVEAVKLAEGASGDVIVRLYEPHGARSHGRLEASFDAEAVSTDLLERPFDAADPTGGGVGVALATAGPNAWEFELRPFQIVTLRLAARPVLSTPVVE
ncbi:alpha-mannosidase [Agromyces italicus]|uniref:alpha-mannosidase n=1 Tax=Agromyces italicus TaxID=279572 RepID=UPI0003B6B8EE|nr:glycoside hydrolase family 38 C-terminal domain-containing protein [Agromyces italicus]